MDDRVDLIQRQENHTKTEGWSIRLVSLPILLLVILAAGFFIKEKLIAHDSVQELESQVKPAKEKDHFTFFTTLPDLKRKGISYSRTRSSTISAKKQRPPKSLENCSRPKADHQAATAVTHPSDESYTIQVAALRIQDEAEKIIQTLRSKGYTAYLVKEDLESKGLWYRVRVGSFSGRSEAEKHLHRLSEDAGLSGFVTASMKSGVGL